MADLERGGPAARAEGAAAGVAPGEAAHTAGAACLGHRPTDHPGRWPGVVFEWRQVGEARWIARVVFAINEVDGRPGAVVIERWLPAGQIDEAQIVR